MDKVELRLSLIKTSFDYVLRTTFATIHAFRPSQLAYSLITLLFINQGLEINQHGDGHGSIRFKVNQSQYYILITATGTSDPWNP